MKRFPLAIRLALLSVVAACSGDKVIVVPPPPPVVPPKIVSIVLSLPDSLVVVARPVTPATMVTDADGGAGVGRALKWASSDTSVATVSATGVVTGWSVGFATITADADGARGTLPITVAFGPPATIIAPGADTLRCVAGDEIFGLPTVFVLDQTGRPVPGVAVSVRADSSSGTITMSAPSTDAKGASARSPVDLGDARRETARRRNREGTVLGSLRRRASLGADVDGARERRGSRRPTRRAPD